MIELSFKQTNAERIVRAAATLLFNALERSGAQIRKLSDLTESPQYGFTASAVSEPVGPKYVRITDLQDGKIAWDSVPFCECPEPQSYLLWENDILFARTGATTGKTHLVRSPEEAVFASYLIRVRPKPNVDPGFLHAFFQSDNYWSQIADEKEGSAQPNVNGAKLSALKIPEAPAEVQRCITRFLSIVRRRQDGENLDLPELPAPFSEQRRNVARIEELAAQIQEARALREIISKEQDALLFSAYRKLSELAPKRPMIEVAPLTRRPVTVDRSKTYPQVSVRSFGRGSFHKPHLVGSEITWEKPFAVEAGDILISNIKAWEGAIAVASDIDGGRFSSHRYLTCVPIPMVATARFVCFHLLTPEGLFHVGEASPGSADRNRTTSAKALMQIPIPAPPYEQQLWFDNLYNQIECARRLQSEVTAELDALLPSILDKAFKGGF